MCIFFNTLKHHEYVKCSISVRKRYLHSDSLLNDRSYNDNVKANISDLFSISKLWGKNTNIILPQSNRVTLSRQQYNNHKMWLQLTPDNDRKILNHWESKRRGLSWDEYEHHASYNTATISSYHKIWSATKLFLVVVTLSESMKYDQMITRSRRNDNSISNLAVQDACMNNDTVTRYTNRYCTCLCTIWQFVSNVSIRTKHTEMIMM